jgi:RND superfamily putative drug exporter
VLHRLTRFVYRRRRAVVIAWLAVLVLTVTVGGRFGGDDTTDYGTPGSESAAANDLLDDRFPSGSGDTIDIVWRADDITRPAIRSRMQPLLDEAASLDHVSGIADPYVTGDADRIADDGTVAFATLQLDTWDMPAEVTRELLDAADDASGD